MGQAIASTTVPGRTGNSTLRPSARSVVCECHRSAGARPPRPPECAINYHGVAVVRPMQEVDCAGEEPVSKAGDDVVILALGIVAIAGSDDQIVSFAHLV